MLFRVICIKLKFFVVVIVLIVAINLFESAERFLNLTTKSAHGRFCAIGGCPAIQSPFFAPAQLKLFPILGRKNQTMFAFQFEFSPFYVNHTRKQFDYEIIISMFDLMSNWSYGVVL